MSKSAKPDTREAMAILIGQIREAIPLELTAEEICRDEDECRNCSIKLIEYLSAEVDSWDYRLAQDETPTLKDLSRLAKTGKKIFRALQKNGLVTAQ